MSVDFPALLYRTLPGLYRDKDTAGELRRFLEILSQPLAAVHASITQLQDDYAIERCNEALIPLVGTLVGVTVDPTQPARVQRSEVQDAIPFYRRKGLRSSLERYAETLTGWPGMLVDFSDVVAQIPYVESLNPIVTHRDRPVGEEAPASGRFHFRADRALQSLFDAVTGRPISRAALNRHEAEYAGVQGRFTIEERGIDLFTRAAAPYTVVAADLADFSTPRTPGGAPLVVAANQVAVDPVLGRFRMVPPLPVTGNLRVTYSELVPSSTRSQAFHIGDPGRMAQLGRPDDPAPYSLDLRAPRRASERIGQKHFDNLGVFFMPGRVIANRRPNVLPPHSESGRFSFDNRPIAVGDVQGIALQLFDAYTGAPITRRVLAGHEADFCGTVRGFTIRIRGTSVTDPAFATAVRVRAANLTDFATPTDANGAPLVLAATDIAVDPQLGRFRLDLTALGARAEDIRVDYLLGPATRVQGAGAGVLSPLIPEAFAFATDGASTLLRDAFDGAPLSVAFRLGKPFTEYHGTVRGWTIYRNGAPITATLTAELRDLENLSPAVPAGRIGIDTQRGRFKFPAGFLAPGDRITVDYAFEDIAERERVFQNVAQRLPRALPAGIVAVLVDTRRDQVDPAKVN
jgi:phage tail-like protein